MFFCKGCRRGAEATDPPAGWLRLQVHDPTQQARDGRTWTTLALFCGVGCLTAGAADAAASATVEVAG